MTPTLLLTVTLLLLMKTEWTTGDDLDPLSDEFIDAINNEQSLWKAGRNFGPDTSINFIRKLMGTILDRDKFRSLPVFRHNLEDLEIPDEFDWREHFPNCTSLSEIRDQGACNSCWAVSSAAAMTDRICIHSGGKIQVRISEENLLSCCTWCTPPSYPGCGGMGGFPEEAFNYWHRVGIVSGGPYGSSEGCQPYEIPPCEHVDKNGPRPSCSTEQFDTPKCKTACREGYSTTYKDDLYFAQSDAYSILNDIEQIQAEIMKNGPVVARFDAYADIIHYTTGVYRHVKGEPVGGHAVKILGWGVENGTPYWLIANSWNTDWGNLNGYFKFLRGKNECNIEDSIFAGLPA